PRPPTQSSTVNPFSFSSARHLILTPWSQFKTSESEFPFWLPTARHYIPFQGFHRILIFFGRGPGLGTESRPCQCEPAAIMQGCIRLRKNSAERSWWEPTHLCGGRSASRSEEFDSDHAL